MRATFILSSFRLSGGVRAVVEYANRLSQRGHAITLIIPGGTSDAVMESELHPAVALRQTPIRLSGHSSKLDYIAVASSMALITPPSDVVISTHAPTTVATLLATRFMRKGVPVWFYQDYLDMFRDRPVEQWLLRHATPWHRLVVAVSDYAADELRQFAPGNIKVLHIGLSHADVFSNVARSTDKAHGRHEIIYLGDMRPRKGLQDFLAAAEILNAAVSDLKLVIVSKEECSIRSNVPFDYVHRPTRQELARLYTQASVFVSASWWESLCLPPLEAMACGTPVVVTDSGGVRAYAETEMNCLMTPPRDPQALASAILRILNDEKLAMRLSQAGLVTAARFDWEYATDAFERLLILTASYC